MLCWGWLFPLLLVLFLILRLAALTAAATAISLSCHCLQTLYLLAMQEIQTTTDVTGAVHNFDAIAKIHGQSLPYQGACNPACAASPMAGCPAGTGRCSLSAG